MLLTPPALCTATHQDSIYHTLHRSLVSLIPTEIHYKHELTKQMCAMIKHSYNVISESSKSHKEMLDCCSAIQLPIKNNLY